MSGVSHRWQGWKSDFPWEEDALRHIRDQMPEAEPYRAWQTFTFTASTGHVREVDLFIATPGGLFLVEIKSHPGRVTNNGSTWLFRDERTRTLENPLHFADQKAKELAGRLRQAARTLNQRTTRIPRIEPAVFLAAPNLRCDLDEFQRARVFGRDGLTGQTGLPGIWHGFLNQPPRSEQNRVTPTLSRELEKLLQKIGIQRLHKQGKIGPYELEPRAFDAGPTWEDYLASNPALPGDQVRRVRIYLSELGATREARESTRRAARREYLALQGISHDGIVRAEQYSDEHDAGPAVVFRHGKNWQRLDQFMAAQANDLPIETRVEMVRQLAEAVDHAHRRHLYHRALAARCVYVEMDGRYPRLRICDWQVAARPANGTTMTTGLGSSGPGPASLAAHIERSAGPYLAPEFGSPDAPPVQLDVFGLGALSYLILTGQPPAETRAALAQRLAAERALTPAAEGLTAVMDRLIRSATAVQPADRTESVRDFLRDLDDVEDELTAPEPAEEPDPLTAGKGTVIKGWTVERVLGKGSTARALLAEKSGEKQVLKVALNDPAAQRLTWEAARLRKLTDSRIVRLIDGPFEVGNRTVIVLDRAGERTLADEIRQQGPLTIGELEKLGEDLLHAVLYLEEEKVWHRDIKPDNLALREVPRKGRRLVLFDFSLADVPDSDIGVGTPVYLDPFLGTGHRLRYDQAAERYAVAVTLHEMASGELPSWGDGMVEASMLDRAEQLPHLAEDSFDPVLRDRLVEFFNHALHRDVSKRFGSLKEMTRAWTDVFRNLDEAPPLTTRHTITLDDSAEPDEARDAAAKAATAETPLAAAGLTARALSIAQQQLGVTTVRELVRVQPRRIMQLRGIGIIPRNELVRRARQWRLQLGLTEVAGVESRAPDAEREVVRAPGTAMPPGAGGTTDVSPVETLDEVARQLIPSAGHADADAEAMRLILGLPDMEGRPSPVAPWAGQREIERKTGRGPEEVTGLVGRLRERWAKSVPAVTRVRDDVVAILAEHGRVLGSSQVAAALLTRRGSDLQDPAERLRLASVCARAAIDTETRLEHPRLAARRTSDQVLVALTPVDDAVAPTADYLIDYALQLGLRADELAGRDPLPSVMVALAELRAVPHPGPAPLSDTDLVALAAAASTNTSVTGRLELYPRDLPAERALKLSQIVSYLSAPLSPGTREPGAPDRQGLSPAELRNRVLARFPDLTGLPDAPKLRDILRGLKYDVQVVNGRYVIPVGTQASAASSRPRTGTETRYGTSAQEVWQRLDQARERGGFVAIKAWVNTAAQVTAAIARLDEVTPVNVTTEFVAALHAIVEEQGRPRWETVLATDSATVTPSARVGFSRLVDEAWRRLDERIRSAPGVVFLHDATPLARYTGGDELLARLVGSARRADEAPHGLWLLCPMRQDLQLPPRLDKLTIGIIPGDAEQLVVPSAFTAASEARRAS
jgi:serine/threonine protein kinase